MENDKGLISLHEIHEKHNVIRNTSFEENKMCRNDDSGSIIHATLIASKKYVLTKLTCNTTANYRQIEGFRDCQSPALKIRITAKDDGVRISSLGFALAPNQPPMEE